MSEERALEIKEKIISIFKDKGPCLPVNVAKETGLSLLFASAFLSEFLSEKKIKISNMKVGSSPLYFIPGQEKMLENFSDYLKSKEKEAFILLKEKKILKDSEQEPAIRVALRAIKDFAIFFNKNGEIYWRYFNIPETDLKNLEKGIKKPKNIQKRKEIKDKKPKENKFFNIVKEFLSGKNMKILEILKFSKNELILKIETNNEEKIAIAYNKKRVGEKDIIKANKEASEFNLPYLIMSLGEPLKKTNEFMDALKNLSSIEKLK